MGNESQPPLRRCPLNAAGAFYTKGDGLFCGFPESFAPDLLAPLTDGNHTTYFVKQPQTADEVDRACHAVYACCVDDLRYGGQDQSIIERLGNSRQRCDYVIRDGKIVPAGPDD